MEHRTVKPAQIEGSISAPPSKSMMIRAAAVSLLADGQSLIHNPALCEDALASLSIIESLGAKIEHLGTYIAIKGNGGLEKEPKRHMLDCRESGLSARLFIPVASLRSEEIMITGTGSLLNRPFRMVEELNKFGVSCVTNNGFLPVAVKGRIRSGIARIDGSITSQFLSGLLMTLPLTDEDSYVSVEGLKSKPYILMTIEILRISGIEISFKEDMSFFHVKGAQRFRPINYTVEGDWSSASFFLVGAAIAGSLKVKNLNIHTNQADKKIMDALEEAGAKIKIEKDAVSVERDSLKPFEFNAEDSPDLIPPLFALAAFCPGKSIFFGIERLKYKESNRIQTLYEGFSKIGVPINVYPEKVEVFGGKIKGGIVDSMNDHRIAMAFAISALGSKEGITIFNADCVKKSYPDFFLDLERVKK